MPFSEKSEEDGVLTHSTNPSSESARYDDGGKARQRKKETRQLPFSARLLKKLKIIFPHVALTVLLFAYMTGGAAMLQWLENREASADRDHSLAEYSSQPEVLISRAVEKVANMCASPLPIHCDHTVGEISNLLSRAAASCQKLPYAAAQLPYWSFRMSFLYILTVVTTTGYDQVSPATTSGRWFSMLYGLIGIPLMLLTIANFGVFLSETVMLIAKWSHSFMRSAKWRLQRLRAKPNVDRRDVYPTEANLKQQQQQPTMAVPAKRGKRRRLSHILFFIAFAYIGLVLFYCFISSHIFMLFERQWTTVAGMFFSFNTITTIGLGNMRLDSDLYVVFVILHNMVGLAMLTMCVNLASTYFKLLFLKLHYFGRKMRRFRSALDTMSGEMVEAMRIVLKLMKIKANKGSITIDDIQELLEAVKDIHVEPRRAFTPNDVSCIPFADD